MGTTSAFGAWVKAHGLSNNRVAAALGVSTSTVNRLATVGDAPTLRYAGLVHELTEGEVGWEEMLPGRQRTVNRQRARAARRTLGLD